MDALPVFEDHMTLQSLNILGPESSAVDLAAQRVLSLLSSTYSTAVFRPAAPVDDPFTAELTSLASASMKTEQAVGVRPCQARHDRLGTRATVVSAYHSMIEEVNPQAVVVVNRNTTTISDPQSFIWEAQVAADLQTCVLLAVSGKNRTANEIRETLNACSASISKTGASVYAVCVIVCSQEQKKETTGLLKDYNVPVWILPCCDKCERSAEDSNCGPIESFPKEELLAVLSKDYSAPVTPYAFEYNLLSQAKASGKTIVLPEGEEDRIIQAADYLLERQIVNLLIVGNKDSIMARAKELNLQSLEKATFQAMDDETVLEPMIEKLCQLRASKGLTPEDARRQLTDPSYFGTMLVVMGKADGLVSGSVNSTANTVRPALQVIKTRPDASLVSGAFIMCFADHIAIFADCAINLNPNAGQLADIALQSARTARSFGLEPRIGMLSYSTLGSGKGPDVDLVEEATALVKERDSSVEVVGSIQFDAAWSPEVAATKAKGNTTAGHVNVFVFPDLCAGNIAYKAVQRSSGAVAVGPVLQGLNKPVNDLSRGATVRDIINTIALTAVID